MTAGPSRRPLSLDDHFDTLETRSADAREATQLAALGDRVAYAKVHAPAFAATLAHVDPRELTSRTAVAQLPVLRKSELLALQKDRRPFGALAAAGWGARDGRGPRAGRVFSSPGPIYEPEGLGDDYWRLARALYAAGFRAGDLVHNCFSYHFTPAGSMLESGALALGCTVFPGGIGQTEQQVQTMSDLGADAYVGTPSFLRIILEKADELGIRVPRLTKALVSGEAFTGGVRSFLAERRIAACQVYASADAGSIAYESPAHDGLIVDEGVLLEIVRPGTGDPVPAGEVGEVVVTLLYNDDYPLIRFATGDLSATLPGVSACGRTNMRIKGWLGRADQATKVKGMFVHPSQVADIVRRHPGIGRARLIVDNPGGNDRMTLHIEASDAVSAEAVVASMREVTKLRGEVALHAVGELANDGKIIDDTRALS